MWLAGKEPEWIKSDDPIEVMEGALLEIEAHLSAGTEAAVVTGVGKDPRWRCELRKVQRIARVALKRIKDLREAAL